MTDHPMLFEGEFMPATGRLSNELLLIRDCPDEFRDPENPWRAYALAAIYNCKQLDTEEWQWQQFHSHPKANLAVRQQRERCFTDMRLAAWRLDHPTHAQILRRAAVMGWMLSEMLTSVPDMLTA